MFLKQSLEICHLPAGDISEAANVHHIFKEDFVNGIGWPMIVFVHSSKKEHDRDSLSGKIVMVAAPVELVWVIVIVVQVIQTQADGLFVCTGYETVQLHADLVRPNNIHVPLVICIRVLLVDPADHVHVNVGDRLLQWKQGMV